MRLGDWVFYTQVLQPISWNFIIHSEDINNDVRDYILNRLDIDENADKNSHEYKLHKLIGSNDA